MKKLSALIFASVTLLLPSCVRDYDCVCGKPHSSHDVEHIHDTRRNAKKSCEGSNWSLPDSEKCVLSKVNDQVHALDSAKKLQVAAKPYPIPNKNT
jgi:hypothetical protein